MSKLGQLIATLEDLQIETVVPMTPEECAEVRTDIAQSVIEVNDTEAEATAQNAAIEDAYTTVDSLDEAAAVLRDTEGEVTPLQISTVEALYKNVLHTLGMSSTESTLESYSGMSKATLIATLEEKSEGIVSKIWAGVKAMFQTVLNFIGQLFKNKTILGKYLESLDKQIDGAHEAFAKGGEVSSKFKNADMAKKAIGDCEKSMEFGNTQLEDIDELNKKVRAGVFETTGTRMKDPRNLWTKRPDGNYGNFGGGTSIAVEEMDPIEGDKGKENGIMLYKLKVVTPDQPVTMGARLTISEAGSLMRDAKSALASLSNMKKHEGVFKKFINDFADGFGHTKNKIQAERSHGFDRSFHTAKSFNRAISLFIRNNAHSFGLVIPSLTFKTIKQSADYIRASMAA